MPVQVLTQICELLNAIFPDKETAHSRRLQEFERQKLVKYSLSILEDDGVPDLMRVIGEVRERMRQESKRKPTHDAYQMQKRLRDAAELQEQVPERVSESSQDSEREKHREADYTMKLLPTLTQPQPESDSDEAAAKDVRLREESASPQKMQRHLEEQMAEAERVLKVKRNLSLPQNEAGRATVGYAAKVLEKKKMAENTALIEKAF